MSVPPTAGDRPTPAANQPQPEPELQEELVGIVSNVVFPTAIEPLDESAASAYDVYYGMADSRIGVARLRRSEPRS